MPAEFVAEHGRQGMRVEPLDEVQVGVAEPGAGGAQQHLARSWLAHADLLDDQRLVGLVQDGGFHVLFLPRTLVIGCLLDGASITSSEFQSLRHGDWR